MRASLQKWIGTIVIGVAVASQPIFAKPKSQAKKPAAKQSTKAATQAPLQMTPPKPQPLYTKNMSVEQKFEALKKAYRKGEINDGRMWQELSAMNQDSSQLLKDSRASLLQAEAHLLYEAKYPILATIYAAEALKLSSIPMSKEFLPSWEIISNTIMQAPVQDIIEDLTAEITIKGNAAPEMGRDWQYFAANAAANAGNKDKAIELYEKLSISDRYFLIGRYQAAMLKVEQGKLQEAENLLNSIIIKETSAISSLPPKKRATLENYSRLALGRLNYQQKEFMKAMKYYRSVSRDSPLFYDALFEQAWAFFMAGYPDHSLGAIYSVESPFFKQEFNPEATMLRSIVNYWMCRYDDSREALADFMEYHATAVESLSVFLDRQRLTSETAYQLFENYATGVSEQSLGIPKQVLDTASTKDSMILVRDNYAALLEEKASLTKRGVFKKRDGLDRPIERLNGRIVVARKNLGDNFLSELRALHEQYDQLYDQAQFLYLELLMSQKEQILGRELHASTKINRVSMKRDVSGWGKKTMSWDDASSKKEFWWDEVGFYISKAQPMCNVQ